MNILLNNEEIRNCWPAGQGKGYTPTPFDYVLGQAQLKKLWDLINEKSPETVFLLEDLTFWGDFKKEAGIDESISR